MNASFITSRPGTNFNWLSLLLLKNDCMYYGLCKTRRNLKMFCYDRNFDRYINQHLTLNILVNNASPEYLIQNFHRRTTYILDYHSLL